MKGYSWSKSDFREILYSKYNDMKEFVLITTPDCSKCKFIKPSIEKWCKENGYKFTETEYADWMTEVTSVPCARVDNQSLDFEWILHFITKS